MKSKLLKLTVAALMVFTIKTQAQVTPPATYSATIFDDGFETWAGTPLQPTMWMQMPNTTLPATAVTQGTTTNTAESGSYYCNLVNTSTTYSYMCTAANFSVTQGTGYTISYYARGKGDISVGIATGTVLTSTGGAEPIGGKGWFHYYNTVIAPTTTNNAQFFIKVKETGTYSKSGVTVTGIDVDSFVVRPYTPVANVNLYSLQFTNATSGNSPFWGQAVGMTGGIVTRLQLATTGGVDGYYVQNSGATSWAAMSVFDFTNSPLVHVGDSITFGGSIDEFFDMTQMSNIVNFTNVSTSNGHSYTLPSLPLNMQTMAQEEYEAMLINIQGASMATASDYTSSYGQANLTDGSGVAGLVDFKDGFYSPNGNATSGSSGTPGYIPTAGINYCLVGNVIYSFGYNIEPGDSGDVYKNCTVLGIKNYNNALHANVYPNPANNQLTITLPTEASKVSVSFTDVLGKEVMTMNNLSGSTVSINDISSLPAGVYMVKIVADGNTQVVKVIKQ